MAGQKLGSFGELPFICSADKVQTFKNLTREHNARWAQHDILGAKPVLEYVGPGLSKASFSMRFDASLGVNPVKAIDRMKRAMENAKYKTLTIGDEVLGRFVIESISEERKYYSGDGILLSAEITLSLIEWVG